MTASSAALTRRSRWAISFADLALLLLGFFVLLQASEGRRREVVEGVARQFGAPVAHSERLAAAQLFQPGEALLTPAGAARLAALAVPYRTGPDRVELRSVGLDRGTYRFDNWDLAAARVGAVARALVTNGIPRARIVIRGLDQEDGASRSGQTLILTRRPADSPASE